MINVHDRALDTIQAVLDALRRRARQHDGAVLFKETGTVQGIGSGVAMVSGLPSIHTDELVQFSTGVQGLVFSLDDSGIDVILLGPDAGIRGGDSVTSLGQQLRVPVGRSLLGRVINPLGQPLDQMQPVRDALSEPIERAAPGIIERSPISQPLYSGLKIVDALIPIGRGQRELIVGDRQTGKTSIAVDIIMHQADQDVFCVYVAVGQKKAHTRQVIDTLRAAGALAYSVVVATSPDDPPALRYLAPYAGCTIAEYFLYDGHDALIVYDDLTKHADTYRELSLLLRRPPGRDAYPGDIFYLHSRLLERAGKLDDDHGGGSLTALPIVETQRGQLAAYIPTNLISITDGQLVTDARLFNLGIKPAVNAGKSVSRVGGAAQTAAMRALSGHMRLELAQYEEVARFTRFGAEVSEATRRQIERGERLQKVLTQIQHQPLPLADQVLILFAATEGYLDALPVGDIPAFEQALIDHANVHHPALKQRLTREGTLDAALIRQLHEMLAAVRDNWLNGGA